MDIDLSLPFRKAAAQATATVAEATTTVAAEGVSKVISKAGWKLWVGGFLVAIVLYYVFMGDSKKVEKMEVVSAPPPPPPNYFAQAEEGFKQYSADRSDRDAYEYAIENYTIALNEQSGEHDVGYVYNQVATLYHQGVPEQVAPNAQDAIFFYREAIKNGYHGAVLPLASIYHWGLPGYEGNREVAKHLYGAVLKTGSDYEKGLAKDRLTQMLEETGQTIGTGMLEDEGGVSGNFSTGFTANPYGETFMDLDKSPYAIGKDAATKDIDEKYVDDLIQNKLGIRGGRKDDEKKGIKRFSDPQNARDHIVVNSVKQSLERLRAETHIQYDIPTTFKMINEYILKKSDAPADKKELASQVLRELAKGMTNTGYEQSKETEALKLVWNRIHSQVYAQDNDKRRSLCENLVNELAESIEYGELVCPTGRLNRIIDTLNHQDPLVNIQPKWAIQQSMVARAGAIQKTLLDKSSSEVREAMKATAPNARQRQLQDDFIQKVKSSIERDLTKTYVDSGIMSKDLLKTEIDAWIL